MIFDASVGPQDIAYPTDLDLLSDAREKTEELIDKQKQMHKTKQHKVEQNTSESRIANIILVLNLVKLAGVALHCIIWKWMVSFSARRLLEFLIIFQQDILGEPEPALEIAYCNRTTKQTRSELFSRLIKYLKLDGYLDKISVQKIVDP